MNSYWSDASNALLSELQKSLVFTTLEAVKIKYHCGGVLGINSIMWIMFLNPPHHTQDAVSL